MQNRKPSAFVLLLRMLLMSPACAPAATGFDVARARAHLDMLAGTIGSRPVGTPANRRAREYIAGQLAALGFTVRIQDAIAVNERAGLSTRVANIIAVRDGARPDAIALVSHYDSAPEASGAIDDGIGVATSLEAARVLTAPPLDRSLMVLVTDAEEFGLMGARALVKDPEVAARMRVFLNFDNTGASGPSLLYEVNQGLGDHLAAWAGSAPAPSGASFATEIYKRLPNDTDFSVLKRTGAAGLNFAVMGDAYAYHTDRDVPQRVASATLQRSGDNTVAIVRALGARDALTGPAPATFFDLAGRRGVAYGPGVARAVFWTACLAAGAAWILLTMNLVRAHGGWGALLTPLWTVLGVVVAARIAVWAAAAIRALRDELNPYYASPHWYYAWIATSGIAGAALIAMRVGACAAGRAALARCRRRLVGGASSLDGRDGRRGAVRAGGDVPARRAAARRRAGGRRRDQIGHRRPRRSAGRARRHRDAVGEQGVVADDVRRAAVRLAADRCAGLGAPGPRRDCRSAVRPTGARPRIRSRTKPPARLDGRGGDRVGARRHRDRGRDQPGVFARPARTSLARYIQDDVQHRAWFEVGGPEPRPGVGASGPVGAVWEATSEARPEAALPALIEPMRAAFAFRTATTPLVASPPAAMRSSFGHDGSGRLTFEIEITAHEPIGVEIVLPPRTPLLPEAVQTRRPADGRASG